MVELYFAKKYPNATIPTKRDEDAGYDLYPCLNGVDEKFIIIGPCETKLVPTGIVSAFSEEWVAVLKERGSTGVEGLGQRSGVMDSGYRGEWLVPITNHNKDKWIVIGEPYNLAVYHHVFRKKFGIDFIVRGTHQAISQFILLPVPKTNISELTIQELIPRFPSNRGANRLGSTDNKEE